MSDNDAVVTFANHGDAIPIIPATTEDDDMTVASDLDVEVADKKDARKRGRFMDKVLGKLDGYGSLGTGSTSSLQDRLFDSLMSTMLPAGAEGGSDDEDEGVTNTVVSKDKAKGKRKDSKASKDVARPNFSPMLMGQYLRRFNARIGVVFVLQNEIGHLCTWRRPTATLSFLAIYTLLCLQPHLLLALPLFGMLVVVMIPAFIARHPTPENDPRLEPQYKGPPSAPPSRLQPAEATSRDFWRNMRDLQNIMEDFSRGHDAVNRYLAPYTNFSDEGLSSLIFVLVFVVMNLALVASAMVPFQTIALLAGWTVTIAGHPSATAVLTSSDRVSQARRQLTSAQEWLRRCIDADIALDSPAERREVEIFELQRHDLYADEWEAWLFSASPHDPLCPARLSGARPRGTQFFEDVQPPSAWAWRDKKWTLDLASQAWVEQRMITDVEIETQGERWVYDLPNEEVGIVKASKSSGGGKGKGKVVPKSGWEEATGLEKRGDWRRRRWVRVVERRDVVG